MVRDLKAHIFISWMDGRFAVLLSIHPTFSRKGIGKQGRFARLRDTSSRFVVVAFRLSGRCLPAPREHTMNTQPNALPD